MEQKRREKVWESKQANDRQSDDPAGTSGPQLGESSRGAGKLKDALRRIASRKLARDAKNV